MPGITYTIAVRDKAGAVTGVFTIDFHLSRLVELARELQFSMNGRVVITTADHSALAHPLRPVVRKAAAGPELVPVKDLGDPAMSAFIARGAGVTSFEIAGEPYELTHCARPLGLPGYLLGGDDLTQYQGHAAARAVLLTAACCANT